MPQNIDDYVHRIGRTGRAGNTGNATAFINEKNSNILPDLLEILSEANQEVPPWFTQFMRQSYPGRGSGIRGRRGGGDRSGGFDHRRKPSFEENKSFSRGSGSQDSHDRDFRSSESDSRHRDWDEAPHYSSGGGSYGGSYGGRY